MTNETMHHNGYQGSVLFDPEENLFHGRILGIRDFVLYDGKTISELADHFREAVDEYVGLCEEDGRRPDTPFAYLAVRVSPEIHQRASQFAQEHEWEMNLLVEKALTEYLEHAE